MVKNAMAHVRRVRPRSIESRKQEDCVAAFAAYLREVPSVLLDLGTAGASVSAVAAPILIAQHESLGAQQEAQADGVGEKGSADKNEEDEEGVVTDEDEVPAHCWTHES